MEVEISQNSYFTESLVNEVIKKTKQYNLRSNSSKKYELIEEAHRNESNEDSNLQLKKKIVKKNSKSAKVKPKKALWVRLEYPITNQLAFPLIGNVIVETKCMEMVEIKFQIKEIEKSNNYFSICPRYIEANTQFDNVINILVNSQCQKRYQLSELLKKYQNIVVQQLAVFDELGKEILNPKFQQLISERKQFKLKFINDYIKKNLKDEDFFVVCNIGTNFIEKTSHLDSLHMSKSYCSLIGVDEEQFSNLFLRFRSPFLFLSQKAREYIYVQYLQSYLKDDYNNPVIIKDFEINTSDELTFYCESSKQFIKVEYPDHLKHPKLDQLHMLMDNINIGKLNVSEHHLKQIIQNRAIRGDKQFEDFEYSLLSQIFMEKFYPSQFTQIQKIQQEQEQKELEILKYQQLQNKICSYRFLNQLV
ncbi:hypothetical protein TTHERM_00756070 (macronuclear) [Tetrahymena thermophila SB210]|uniref:Uncharacterized protein n=1 Tax=Tetrahymena thermophila (strain SB210) TaxID=312017 RepID=I7MFN6_TETTS|nr:hypothetical protein TTHERM_00756070 [Tetrahymena thermophila SB210]EAR84073.1 hypothetical protein TTHERM_00756070 [Tetrahymena thermophila SB210]|eukprot:XP_001031736.1 hypothetical protein TTHERM_00756070 [Tetrahymena thermophila SB210]